MVQFLGRHSVEHGIGTAQVVVDVADPRGELQAGNPHCARKSTIAAQRESG
jgi:hypothetical protein